jgi:2-polyprenyl-3-methyl-5-hydroxy-6-metoxy-1,4-benzoquinol methylase
MASTMNLKPFEAALMADVLEHFERPTDALREARRVIKGSLYISTPPKRADGKLNDKYHYVEWTASELTRLVEQVGFALDGEILTIAEEKTMYGKFRKV